jgi:hypothetical protein
MTKVRLNEVSDDVRAFLNRAFSGGGLVVEDESGRARGGVLPYFEATDTEKREAWKGIERLQQQVAASMARQGITEDAVDQALRDDE